jgi:geranylgeranyl diphosphate synthase type I
MPPSTQGSLDTATESKVSLAAVIPTHAADAVPCSLTPGGAEPVAAFFAAVRARVDARLRAVLAGCEAFTREAAPDAIGIVEATRDLTFRGGKRLRPALLAASVACVDPGAFPEAVVDLGAALELLQTYLLVHDDWMDDDPVRRGAPSVHVALAARYGDRHVGASAAILAGDLMGTLVHDLVAGIDLPAPRRRAVLAAFTRMEHEVILGQCLDVTHSPDTDRVHHLKTGSYTVRGPLVLGLEVAGGGEAARRALDGYGAPLGVAFQLRDDVLGAFGSEAETGKPVGGDFREGKHTALVQHALAQLPPPDAAELASLLGRRDSTADDIARVRGLIESSGARAHVEDRIRQLRAQAIAALQTDALRPDGRELLAAFATLMTERRQ